MSTYVLCLDSPLSGFPIWRAENWKTSHPPKGPLSPRSPFFRRPFSSKKIAVLYKSFQLWASVQATKNINPPQPGKASENCFLPLESRTNMAMIHLKSWYCGVLPWWYRYVYKQFVRYACIHTVQYSTVQYITLHYIALHCITLNCSTLQYIHTNRLPSMYIQ